MLRSWPPDPFPADDGGTTVNSDLLPGWGGGRTGMHANSRRHPTNSHSKTATQPSPSDSTTITSLHQTRTSPSSTASTNPGHKPRPAAPAARKGHPPFRLPCKTAFFALRGYIEVSRFVPPSVD